MSSIYIHIDMADLMITIFHIWTLVVCLSRKINTISDKEFTNGCPVVMPCHCQANVVLQCSSVRLKQLPTFLEFTFIWNELDLSDNLLNTLPPFGLQVVHVKKLDFSANTITIIHEMSLSGVQGLEFLDLSHNYLTYIPPLCSAELPQLRILHLNYNRWVHLTHLSCLT